MKRQNGKNLHIKWKIEREKERRRKEGVRNVNRPLLKFTHIHMHQYDVKSFLKKFYIMLLQSTFCHIESFHLSRMDIKPEILAYWIFKMWSFYLCCCLHLFTIWLLFVGFSELIQAKLVSIRNPLQQSESRWTIWAILHMVTIWKHNT